MKTATEIVTSVNPEITALKTSKTTLENAKKNAGLTDHCDPKDITPEEIKTLMTAWHTAATATQPVQETISNAKKAYIAKAAELLKIDQGDFDLKKKQLDDHIANLIAAEKETAIRENWSKEVAERRKNSSLEDLKKEISDLSLKISLKELDIKNVDAEIATIRSASDSKASA